MNPPQGRVHRSRACRNWYAWRRAADEETPLWVALAPPWPVIRLACRMSGKSSLLAAVSLPLRLLASVDGDRVPDVADGREPRVKSKSRWARLVGNIGVGPSSA